MPLLCMQLLVLEGWYPVVVVAAAAAVALAGSPEAVWMLADRRRPACGAIHKPRRCWPVVEEPALARLRLPSNQQARTTMTLTTRTAAATTTTINDFLAVQLPPGICSARTWSSTCRVCASSIA